MANTPQGQRIRKTATAPDLRAAVSQTGRGVAALAAAMEMVSPDTSWLISIIGTEATIALMAASGGKTIALPKLEMVSLALKYAAATMELIQGADLAETARKHSLQHGRLRQVYRYAMGDLSFSPDKRRRMTDEQRKKEDQQRAARRGRV